MYTILIKELVTRDRLTVGRFGQLPELPQRAHDPAPLPLRTPFPKTVRPTMLSKEIQCSSLSRLGSSEAIMPPSILNLVLPLHGPLKSPALSMKM